MSDHAAKAPLYLDNGEVLDAEIWPEGSLEVLSQLEVEQLRDSGEGGLYPLLRQCMLAVLNSGSPTDDARQVLETYSDFSIGFVQQDRGLKLTLKNAPAHAFVEGRHTAALSDENKSVTTFKWSMLKFIAALQAASSRL